MGTNSHNQHWPSTEMENMNCALLRILYKLKRKSLVISDWLSGNVQLSYVSQVALLGVVKGDP